MVPCESCGITCTSKAGLSKHLGQKLECVEWYATHKCPQRTDMMITDDLEAELNWRDHPEYFICPMAIKTCGFNKTQGARNFVKDKAVGRPWCPVCVKRENFTPESNVASKERGKKNFLLKREYKRATGKIHISGSGVDKLISCSEKLDDCGYPNNRKYWCASCIKKAGEKYKPLANIQKEQEVAQAKAKAKAAPKADAKAKAFPKAQAKAKPKPKAKAVVLA